MLIKEDEMTKRINNPLNLINRMKDGLRSDKRSEAMSLFIRPSDNKNEEGKPAKQELNPFGDKEIVETTAAETEDILPDSDSRIKLALAHDKALAVMSRAIDAAGNKLDDIKADKLPGVIVAMSKVVGSIRAERVEREKINKGQDVHLHFYSPEQKKMEQYQVIEVAS